MEKLKEWETSFTKMLDGFLLYRSAWYRTYFWGTEEGGVEITKHNNVIFRVPGATRGYIVVDDDLTIKDIVFYEDACFSKIKCFNKRVVKAAKKYIGTKLELPKFYKSNR